MGEREDDGTGGVDGGRRSGAPRIATTGNTGGVHYCHVGGFHLSNRYANGSEKSTAAEAGRAASPLEPLMSDVIRRRLRRGAHERGILVTRDAQERLSHLGSATWAPVLAGPIHEASTNGALLRCHRYK